MDTLFTAYFERQNRRKVGISARRNATIWLGRFDRWCLLNGVNPKSATIEDIEAWFDQLEGFKPTTIQQASIQIKAAYSYAHRRGAIPADPCVDLYLPPVPDEEPRVFTAQELRQALAAVNDEREDVLLHLFTYAGLRRAEALNLSKQDVDLAHSTMTVIGKGKKLRKVPIHPVLHDVLVPALADTKSLYAVCNRQYPDQPLSNSAFCEMFPPILKRAGIDGTAHVFRKTLTSSLVANGANTVNIDRIMGWSPRTVRDRYYTAVADDSLFQTILLAYRDDPISAWKLLRKAI